MFVHIHTVAVLTQTVWAHVKIVTVICLLFHTQLSVTFDFICSLFFVYFSLHWYLSLRISMVTYVFLIWLFVVVFRLYVLFRFDFFNFIMHVFVVPIAFCYAVYVCLSVGSHWTTRICIQTIRMNHRLECVLCPFGKNQAHKSTNQFEFAWLHCLGLYTIDGNVCV